LSADFTKADTAIARRPPENTLAVIPVSAISVFAGARNHECYTMADIFWIDLVP